MSKLGQSNIDTPLEQIDDNEPDFTPEATKPSVQDVNVNDLLTLATYIHANSNEYTGYETEIRTAIANLNAAVALIRKPF